MVATNTAFQGRIMRGRAGRIVLDDDMIRRFLELLERKFQSERPYEFKHDLKRRDGLSMCQEITIAKLYVQSLANYCIGKDLVQIPEPS